MSDLYHLVGVAGVGMSALAQALLAQGCRVSGSDRFLDQGSELEVLDRLRAAGIRLMLQDGSGVLADTSGVIVSTAIEPGNPDLEAARSRGVPVIHRAEMLARLVRGRRLIAVTGTSGKTTVTGLIGWLLEQCGQWPTVVNGGAVLNWKTPQAPGNFRAGRDALWVIEADESDRSLLHFEPEWEIITNISRDHFDLRETLGLFRTFSHKARAGVVCGRGVAEALLADPEGEAQGRLIEERLEYEERAGRPGFVSEGTFFPSPLPGLHNVENAWLAVVLCRQLGLDPAALREALSSFRGIERRLERVGESGGVTIVDDYAHNPAKIVAAWRTMVQTHGRILGVWRPHGFGPLAAMLSDLEASLADVMRPQDLLFLLPVFYAGGTARPTVSSGDLAARLQRAGKSARVVESYSALEGELRAVARDGDALLVMGARDPGLPRFARRMLTVLKS
ncbi:MAG: UDP-N-acetylmuramate--alanine ligase [Verrucomicrobia bacterium]|nr:UDP-N-acetylmuramate--alanine ligase [Verrucomicrobiota bacterium]